MPIPINNLPTTTTLSLSGALIVDQNNTTYQASIAQILTYVTPVTGTLAGDSDVHLINPLNGQVLTYSTALSGWTNTTPASAVSGSSTLASDSDVHLSNPANGQILTYSTALSGWTNSTPASAVSGGSSTLANDTDVHLSNLINGQVLTYSTALSGWTNSTPVSSSGSNTFGNLTDVNFSTIGPNKFLTESTQTLMNVQRQSFNVLSATSYSASFTNPPTTGNLLIAYISYRSSSSGVTLPIGWTKQASSGSSGCNLDIWTKISAGSSDQTFITTQQSGTGDSIIAEEWQGAIFNASNILTNTGSNTSSISIPANCYVIAAIAGQAQSNAGSGTAGWTQTFQYGGDNYNYGCGIETEVKFFSSATTLNYTFTFTSGGTNNNVIFYLAPSSTQPYTFVTPTLAGDADVHLSNPTNNQVLTYSTALSGWTNSTPISAAVNTLAGDSDVHLSNLANNQVLTYSTALSGWTNTTPASATVNTLAGLSDVDISNEATGYALVYNPAGGPPSIVQTAQSTNQNGIITFSVAPTVGNILVLGASTSGAENLSSSGWTSIGTSGGSSFPIQAWYKVATSADTTITVAGSAKAWELTGAGIPTGFISTPSSSTPVTLSSIPINSLAFGFENDGGTNGLNTTSGWTGGQITGNNEALGWQYNSYTTSATNVTLNVLSGSNSMLAFYVPTSSAKHYKFNPLVSTLAGDSDVHLSNPSNNQILTYSTALSGWTNTTPASSSIATLAGDSDVHLTNPINGQILTYSTALSGWTNTTPASSTNSSSTLAGDSDVHISSLINGQVLTYSTALSGWTNSNPASGGSNTLAGLSDVSVSAAGAGTVLGYSSSAFGLRQRIHATGGAGSYSSGTATATFTEPILAGSLMVIYASCGGINSYPSGWSSNFSIGGSGGEEIIVASKIAVGGETSVAFGLNSSGNYGGMFTFEEWTGALSLGSISGTDYTTSNTGNVTLTLNSITAGSYVVGIMSNSNNGNVSPATGWTSDYYNTENTSITLYEKLISSAGSVNYTFSGGTGNVATMLIQIKAASAVKFTMQVPLFANSGDIDFTTAGPGKLLSVTTSNNLPYSFQQILSNYDSVILAESSLTQYWPLNDSGSPTNPTNLKGSGLLTVASTGSYYGAAPLLSDGENSLMIDGSGAAISGANSSIPNLTTGPWTFEFIANFVGYSGTQAAIFNVDGGNDGPYVYVNVTNESNTYALYNGSSTYGNGSTFGAKAHFAIVVNSSKVFTFYINGVPYASNSVNPSSGTFYLSNTAGSGIIHGRIAKVAIYNVALTFAQMQAHVKAAGI